MKQVAKAVNWGFRRMQEDSSSHLVPFKRFSLLADGRVSNLQGPVLLGLLCKLLSCSPK